MEFEEIKNEIKATVPLITEDDIRVINNDFDGIVNRFSKMIIKEKDLAKAQYIIKKQQEQIKELKRNSIPKKKIKDKIEEYEELVEDFEKTDNSGRFKRTKSIDYYKLEVFKELLEEDK